MKPKKKEKDKDGKQQQEENTEADLEKFLQTFEKPTKIYRYLRTRHIASPIFLQRTLHFMKHRRTANNAQRKHFRVDSLLQTKVVVKQEQNGIKFGKKFLRLEFIGFFDNSSSSELREVEVEAIVSRVQPSRKDIANVKHSSLGKVMVPVNTSNSQGRTQSSLDGTQSDMADSCGPVIVSREGVDFTQKEGVRSTILHLNVTCHQSRPLVNGMCNGDHRLTDEPAVKRRKNTGVSGVNGRSPVMEEGSAVYGAELNLHSKHSQCWLANGEYDLLLQSQTEEVQSPPRHHSSWLPALNKRPLDFTDMLDSCPFLKFKLTWTDDSEGQVQSSVPPTEYLVNNHYASLYSNSGLDLGSSPVRVKEEGQTTPMKKIAVTYQFLYNDNTRQQTDTRDDLRCPWCSLDCHRLYSLLKHLRLSHPRFNFIYVPHPKGARVDVSLNDCYDGSYSGNPQDLNSHIGFAFSRLGPVRRTSATHVIVYRPKRPSESLLEFYEPEKENQVSRQIIQGHNRLYYRTNTCLPLKPQEIDQDSEDEISPQWLQQKSINLIDEFTDVNEGEKELMKLWNLHCMKYAYISDCQMPQACEKFVEENGRILLEKGIVKNFTVHLVNMFDFSLLTPDIVQRTMWQLHMLREELDL